MRSSTPRGRVGTRADAPPRVAFRLRPRRPHLEIRFQSSVPSPHVPLSTLRRPLSGSRRMTRGQRGSLLLHCWTLSFLPLCRSPDAFGRRWRGPVVRAQPQEPISRSPDPSAGGAQPRGSRREPGGEHVPRGGATDARDPLPSALPSSADDARAPRPRRAKGPP